MIPQYNKKSLWFGLPGFVLQFACKMPIGLADLGHGSPDWVLTVCEIGYWVGTALLIVGLGYYAKSKGRDPGWGLVGLFSIIGLLVLICLKDQTKTPEKPPETPPS